MKVSELQRVYHPFNIWEDHLSGMYKTTCYMDESQMIIDCQLLLACQPWFSDTAYFLLNHWPKATEHNLTNTHRNRQAWLGQACCAFVHGAPEYLVKQAWNMMRGEDRISANKTADEVIKYFEQTYLQGRFSWQKFH